MWPITDYDNVRCNPGQKSVHLPHNKFVPDVDTYPMRMLWKQWESNCHEDLLPNSGLSSVPSHSDPVPMRPRDAVQEVSDVCHLATSATAPLCHAVTHRVSPPLERAPTTARHYLCQHSHSSLSPNLLRNLDPNSWPQHITFNNILLLLSSLPFSMTSCHHRHHYHHYQQLLSNANPTHTVNSHAKFHWNPSIKYRETAKQVLMDGQLKT